MAQKTLYLHIGLHKTGTKTLQTFLGENSKLLSHFGFIYPTAGRDLVVTGGHSLLAWKFFGSDPRFSSRPNVQGDLWSQLCDELAQSPLPNVILSAEDFCFYQDSDVSSFRHRLNELFADVRIIALLRPRRDWIWSMYKQFLICGYSGSLQEFTREVACNLEFDRLLSPWRRAFGPNLIVRNFVKNLEQPRTILDTFFNCLNVTLGPQCTVHSYNVSPQPTFLALIRFYNLVSDKCFGRPVWSGTLKQYPLNWLERADSIIRKLPAWAIDLLTRSVRPGNEFNQSL